MHGLSVMQNPDTVKRYKGYRSCSEEAD